MAVLDYLFQGTAPSSVTSSAVSYNGLPDWYQEYLRGIAGKATGVAGAQQASGMPEQAVAGFTPDQTAAFQKVRDNTGAWQPGLDQAKTMVGGATNAVAGPSANWTDPGVASKYMSPYTSQVVDNIARLGTRNFEENIMPGINASMIGSGQFGSTRNADILSRAGRDAAADITGQQAQALEAGYSTGAGIFGSDAARQQQQQQLQANAGLQGASQLGALSQAQAALGLTDAQALQASGQQQQQLNQQTLNTDFTNQTNAQNYDWNVLNNLNSVLRGLQLPTAQTVTSNAPAAGSTYNQSPLAQVGTALGTIAGSK